MPRKRRTDLYESARMWATTDGIDARLRELTHEVRALRQEIANDLDRNRHARLNDRRLPPDRKPRRTR